MSLVIGILTFILVITSLFLVMVVLMQPAQSDGGMGAAMGGGGMESTFGAQTNSVLTGATIKASVVFFVLSFGLYLANIYNVKHHDGGDSKLPTIIAPASTSSMPVPTMPTATPSTSAGPVPIKTGPSAGPVPVPSSSATTNGPQPTPHPVEPKK
ncbi:MAG: preprotein translocase subunit SecG [Lacunisphaera sp.]